MSRARRLGQTLSLAMLFVTGALGLFNGLREVTFTLTPLQRAVSIGVLIYGVLGVVAGVALAMRHRSSVWLTALWGVAITYVASFAAVAYAGPEASATGAVASGMASALLAAGVIWSAWVSTRPSSSSVARREIELSGR
jgi:hypothetical protein